MHRQNRINLTEERNQWLQNKRWDRRMRHLDFCVKVLVVAFALAYISIIAELF
jgi:hypothetical protein